LSSTPKLPRVEGGWRTILADPPWHEEGAGRYVRGAQRHYPLMSEKQIIAIPVREIVADQAHLYLWTTNNFLPSALRVMVAWGFRYKTCITWGKTSKGFGLGQYFRGMTEHCLFGVRGKTKRKEKGGMLPYRTRPDGKRAQGTTLILAPRREHSTKPDKIYEFAEGVSYPPRLELFARQKRQGWTVWGLEAPTASQLLIDRISAPP
jgi:N6-adenosine-specific RNA methylase IME4